MRAASTSRVSARAARRVIAQHLGVAVRGAALVLAVDLADRGVQIDRQRLVAGACAQSPGTRERAHQHRFELAGVAEREGPQERPHRGGRH